VQAKGVKEYSKTSLVGEKEGKRRGGQAKEKKKRVVKPGSGTYKRHREESIRKGKTIKNIKKMGGIGEN
jgi:hypothetical protein